MCPFDYERANREWKPSPVKPRLFPGPEAKAKMFADRYHVLWQRLMQEGGYVSSAEAEMGSTLPGQKVITPVESLVGNKGRKLTFGLISRTSDQFYTGWEIEDLHKVYPVDLTVKESERLLTDGSFVLAEGELIGNRFVAYGLDSPDAITRSVNQANHEVPAQMFGGSVTHEQLEDAREQEIDLDGMYVVMCEVHLDSMQVLDKLTRVFEGYENAGPPAAYVFMGNFTSSAFVGTAEGVSNYRDGFEHLKFKMKLLPNHVQKGTRFIFIPGQKDPGAQTLPKGPLSDYMTAGLAKEIPGVIMATNPCRLRHCSKELIFFRHDVLRLLRRHEVVPLREPGGGAPSPAHVQQEMVRLLLDQAHLVPLPLAESNVLWTFDHTLRLYPLPDAVFVGGVSQPFDNRYLECNFCSVGPFHLDAAFYAYYPVANELTACDVPDPMG